MGDFQKSYSKMFFKGIHYIIAWHKTWGHCWFCGKYTYLEPAGNQNKTCFSVLDKKKHTELHNVVIVCETCAAERKYKNVEEYREYLYRKEINQIITDKGDPGKVKKRVFWAETRDMNYDLIDKWVGNTYDLKRRLYGIGDFDHPDDNYTMEEGMGDSPISR